MTIATINELPVGQGALQFVLRSFETSGTDYSVTQRRIATEERNPHYYLFLYIALNPVEINPAYVVCYLT